VIEQSGGAISVASRLGHGTTFTVHLPFVAGAVVPSPIPRTAPPTGSGTILVAEDEPVVLDLIVRTLVRSGYEVLAAADGRKATELIDRRGSEIDLLISDVFMPNVGGLELVELVRERHPSLPIVLISGYGVATPPAVTGAPAVVLLAKPFTAQRLTEVVNDTLALTPLGMPPIETGA
jgi:DNA-binding NtrC family response regulator